MFAGGVPADLGPNAGPPLTHLHSVNELSRQYQHHQQQAQQQHYQHLLPLGHGPAATAAAADAAAGFGASSGGFPSSRAASGAVSAAAYHYVHPTSLHPTSGTGNGMGTGGGGGGGTHTGLSRASLLDALPSGPTTADLDDEIMQSMDTDLFENEAAATGSARLGRGGAAAGRSFRSLHGGLSLSGLGNGGGGGGGAVSMVLPGAPAGPYGAGAAAGAGAVFLSSGPHPGPAYGYPHPGHQHQQQPGYAAAVAGLVPGFSRLPDLPEQEADSDTGMQQQQHPQQQQQHKHALSAERLVDRVTAVSVSGLGAAPAAGHAGHAAGASAAAVAAAAAAAPGMHRVDSEELVDVPSGRPAAPHDVAAPFTTAHALAGVQSLFTAGRGGGAAAAATAAAAAAAATAAAAGSSRMPGVSHSAAAAMQSCETSLAGAYHHTHIHAQHGSGGRRRHHHPDPAAYSLCLSGSGRCGSGSVAHCPDCTAVASTSTGTIACISGGPFAAVAESAASAAEAEAARHPALGASPGSATAAAAVAVAAAAGAAGQHSAGSGLFMAGGEMAPRALGWSLSMDHAAPVLLAGGGAVAVRVGAVPYVGSFGPTSAASIAAAAATPPRAGAAGAATTGGTSLGLPGFSSGPISGSIAAAAFRSMDAFAPQRSLAAPSAGGGGRGCGGGSAVIDPRLQLPNTHAGWPGGGGGSSIAAAAAPALPTQLFDNLPDDFADDPDPSGSPVRGGLNGTGGTLRLAKAAAPDAAFDVPAPGSGAAGNAAAGNGDTAAAGACGLSQDGEKMAAAVRALLRFDLPFHPSQPPPDYDSATAAASAAAPGTHHATTTHAHAAHADPAFDDGAAPYAPELPPPGPLPTMPLPASLLASLEPSGVAAVDRYLQQLLLDPSPERHVFLCKRPLGPAACRAVASFLALCPGAVKSITLSYCGITCDGLTALCEGLRSCRDLLVLDLSYNALADMGAAALAACLSDMPVLASLTLAGNAELGDAGVAALAAAARGCMGLRRVGLRGTAATTLGMKDLASALASNLRRAAARRGVPSPPRGPLSGLDRPVTWDGTVGSAGVGGAAGGGISSDAVFITQLCSLLRTLVQPALPAEQAVAEAVAELLAEAPSLLAARQSHGSAAAAAAPPPSVSSGPATAAAAAARQVSSAANSGSGGSTRGLRVLQDLRAAERVGPAPSVPTSAAGAAEGHSAAPPAGATAARAAAAAPESRFSNSNESAAATATGSGDHSASSSAGSGSVTTVGGASIATASGTATGDSDLLAYLAEGLMARGYDVAVTHALGGGSGGECLRNLRHTFLSVTVPLPPGLMPSGPPSPAAAAVAAASMARSAATSAGSAAGGGAGGGAGGAAAASTLAGTLNRRRHSVAYGTISAAAPPGGGAASGGGAAALSLLYHPGVIIVDPELREQFEVAMPTPRYDALVAALPRVYVGAEERLPLVVEVLCDELALALRSKGLIIPPWRESAAMISKWQPKLSKLLVPGTPGYAQQMQQHQQQQQGSRRQSRDGGGGNGGGSGRSSASVTPRVSLAGGIAFGFGGAGVGGAAAMPVPVLWRATDSRSATSSRRNSRVATATGAGGAVAPGDTSANGGFDEPSLGPGHALGSLGSEGSAAVRRAGAHGAGNGNGANVDSLSSSLRRMDSGGCGAYGGGAGAGGGSSAVSSAVHSFGFRRCTSSNSLLSSSVGLTPASGAGGGVGTGAGVASGGVRAAINSRLVTNAAAALMGPQALVPGAGAAGGLTGSGRALWVGGGGGAGGLSPVPHSPPSPPRCI
ncbi:hypothetical protein HXX76_008734 [Chlamydomonas incerta]|uniref:Uncharacterized protein n=1 Tax=Chlamydomonas incerta TaxID=51695 RepID=A0A835SWY5_CHLIN|nr:hypothetical protein HXX76_008734 [Chlamydomonas incerta]|eukprot:KAG2433007.1 hypothetical protein HXX76_008734 [Chlamydomonas incerta]